MTNNHTKLNREELLELANKVRDYLAIPNMQYQIRGDAIVPRASADAPNPLELSLIREFHCSIHHRLAKAFLGLFDDYIASTQGDDMPRRFLECYDLLCAIGDILGVGRYSEIIPALKALNSTQGGEIDEVYEAAKELTDKNGASVVEFEFNNVRFKVSPHRLGRKVYDLQQQLKALPRPNDGWKPIETAPKDGEVILAYRKDAGVFPMHYVEARENSGYEVGPECWFTVFGEDLTDDMPTHWQPLPLPPTEEPPACQ